MENIKLYSKIESLPKELKKEVEDFVQFLLEKVNKKNNSKPKHLRGVAKGMIEMKPDFDDPLEDFKEYTE